MCYRIENVQPIPLRGSVLPASKQNREILKRTMPHVLFHALISI